MSDLESKRAHPWLPGTMVKTCGSSIPLFKTTQAGSRAFTFVPSGEPVIYVDCSVGMCKIIYGENIGWTYSDAVTTLR